MKSDYVRHTSSICDFSDSSSWVILSPIEQSIKRKIEAAGTPLKDWNISIYRGVLTGYNDAFFISSEKREEILNNCLTEEERDRTAGLIRPILRGRDIKRYGYEFAGLYLIATFPSMHYDIEDYPAVKDYLLSFGIERMEQTGRKYIIDGQQVISRKKTNNKWFETQDSIGYVEDFNKPKIVWAELARTGNAFSVDFSQHLVSNTGYILTVTGDDKNLLYYLLGILNSRIILYCLNQITSRFDENGWRWLRQFVEQLKVPTNTDIQKVSELAKTTNRNNQLVNSEKINRIVAEIYGLNDEEQKYINDKLSGY